MRVNVVSRNQLDEGFGQRGKMLTDPSGCVDQRCGTLDYVGIELPRRGTVVFALREMVAQVPFGVEAASCAGMSMSYGDTGMFMLDLHMPPRNGDGPLLKVTSVPVGAASGIRVDHRNGRRFIQLLGEDGTVAAQFKIDFRRRPPEFARVNLS